MPPLRLPALHHARGRRLAVFLHGVDGAAALRVGLVNLLGAGFDKAEREEEVIRVFPRKTKWTPTDPLAFSGPEGAWPPLELPPEQPVRISVTFTDDIELGQRLYRAWRPHYQDVQIGGPALGDPGDEFVPGRFLKEGVTITSRGCIRECPFCLVPQREGRLREISIKPGNIIQDNNLLACSMSHVEKVCEMLSQQKEAAIFSGLDARLLTTEHMKLFKNLRINQLWFAYDSPAEWRALVNTAELLGDYPKNKKWCYVLIGFRNDTLIKAEHRLNKVWDLGFMPFAMLYQGPNGEGHKSREWKQLQRTWCRPAAYKTLLTRRSLINPNPARADSLEREFD